MQLLLRFTALLSSDTSLTWIPSGTRMLRSVSFNLPTFKAKIKTLFLPHVCSHTAQSSTLPG